MLVPYVALCVASHIVNKSRYFSVRIANIAYVALCVTAAEDRQLYMLYSYKLKSRLEFMMFKYCH
jgi:hypothetical protein